MTPSWDQLLTAARDEVAATLEALPEELHAAAAKVPVIYQKRPDPRLVEEGLDPDLLGLFVGDSRTEGEPGTAVPSQILLFLENLWAFAEEDWGFYAEEVEVTFLHELGHYLGLEEEDLEDRGLE
ncbi:MAG: metallopeptidase family protein [Verrucomicrobiales bacterium]|nr:metallopeptidase family protein [Verrucomicrobiales bacterium]